MWIHCLLTKSNNQSVSSTHTASSSSLACLQIQSTVFYIQSHFISKSSNMSLNHHNNSIINSEYCYSLIIHYSLFQCLVASLCEPYFCTIWISNADSPCPLFHYIADRFCCNLIEFSDACNRGIFNIKTRIWIMQETN